MAYKKLYRSNKDRVIGGVCGGLGEFLDIDPTIIRLVWVVFAFFSMGIGIVLYLLFWIIIPRKR